MCLYHTLKYRKKSNKSNTRATIMQVVHHMYIREKKKTSVVSQSDVGTWQGNEDKHLY